MKTNQKLSPVIHPKGERHPGSGRKTGTPNRISVDVQTLAAELVTSPVYQDRLRRDFEQRKVHPTIENMVWAYHAGRPKENITLDVTVTKFADERRAFLALDTADLERLVAEQDRLIEAALELAKGRLSPPSNEDAERKCEESLDLLAGSDNGSSVNCRTGLGTPAENSNTEQHLARAEPSTNAPRDGQHNQRPTDEHD